MSVSCQLKFILKKTSMSVSIGLTVPTFVDSNVWSVLASKLGFTISSRLKPRNFSKSKKWREI